MSRTGRWLLVTDGDLTELVDLMGAMPIRAVDMRPGAVSAFVDRELWIVEDRTLVRLAPTDLQPLAQPARLPGPTTSIVPAGATAMGAVLVGSPSVRVDQRGESMMFEVLADFAPGERLLANLGARLYVGGTDSIRALERGREIWKLAKLEGSVVEMVNLFGGRALAILLRREADDLVIVVQSQGARVHAVPVPTAVTWAVAEELGQAYVLAADGLVTHVDLRYGRILQAAKPEVACADLAVAQDGRQMVVIASESGDVIPLQASELLRATTQVDMVDTIADELPRAEEEEARPTLSIVKDDAPEHNGSIPRLVLSPQPPEGPDARDAAPPPASKAPKRTVEIPDLLPLALGPPPTEGESSTEHGTAPYANARAHLDTLLDIVAARTAVVIADAWNSGRLSQTNATKRPHELEVEALLGGSGGFAPDKLVAAKQRLAQREEEAAKRAEASGAAGIRLPFPTLLRELGLSPVAAQVLLVVAAPMIRGEIARLYGVLSNDPARPIVDRFLVEQIVAGGRGTLRDEIARELTPDSMLVRHGLVFVEPGPASIFARLMVPDALLDRLRGLAPSRADDLAQMRRADVTLEDLLIAPEIKRKLVLALAKPTPAHAPARVVLRGRRGSGRHSIVAALAARIEREIVAIDTARMPRGRRELVGSLRGALIRASLHGMVPVLSGLEQIDPTDNDVRDAVRQVLRTHPGPIVVRTSPESTLPIDPGFISIELPSLVETERAAAWERLLGEAGVKADKDRLASRYRIGPGVIRRVIGELTAVAGGGRGDATAALDEQIRQHVATRLDHVAKKVERLAHWEDVALSDELRDSLREFIGRARQRRTVYEQWAYDTKMTTSRGLTALFYGPPGTGKTMVAGVIAQELGLDMYRVDLARVVSKWVGETEKNLSEVFDAAEDGQVLILFDEADSLFAKRTDVRTSNDRYANLEVNYLLQRLDTFEGIAVLTSNLDGAIDPAFKRRLTLRLQFPFPDEETRVRLWTAHVTPETPIAGDFDFVDLARRFPLSGGYIRNCALRAAFLAAHEGEPMSQQHLLRAIHLEYREIGKLSTTSRLE